MATLVETIKDAMKQAMRAKDKQTLGAIRLLTAAIKQHEVDQRAEVDDATALAIIDKMVKQRRESIKQYQAANRPELAETEQAEIEVLQQFLPAQLSSDEIDSLIAEAVSATGAESMRDMGKVMGWLKPKLQGRADMGAVSGQIKARLG